MEGVRFEWRIGTRPLRLRIVDGLTPCAIIRSKVLLIRLPLLPNYQRHVNLPTCVCETKIGYDPDYWSSPLYRHDVKFSSFFYGTLGVSFI